MTYDGAVATYQTPAALLAQCGPMYTYRARTPLQSMAVDGISRKLALNGTTIVPILGPMDTEAAPTEPRFFTAADTDPAQRAQYIRAMWDGLMVVYYSDGAKQSELDTLREMSKRDDLRMVVRAWKEPTQALPGDRNFAFAVWGASQSCHRFSAKALEDFRTEHQPDESPGPTTGMGPRVLDHAKDADEFAQKCLPGVVCRISVLQ